MFAVAVRVELRILYANSLKEKRRIVKALESGLRRFEVAVAEVGSQDQYRRSTLGLAMVSGSHFQLQRQLHNVERWLRAQPDTEVLEWSVDHLDPD